MWRVVCVGPGPQDRIRRVVDRGPLHPDQARTHALAQQLRATGLYEFVRVEGSSVKSSKMPGSSQSQSPSAANSSADSSAPPVDDALQSGD